MMEITGFSFGASEELQVTFRFDGAGLAAKKLQAVGLLANLEGLLQSREALIDEPAGSPARGTGSNGIEQAKQAAPVPKPPEMRQYKLDSPVGMLDMIAHPSGFFTAQCGMLRATAATEQAAVQELVTKVQTSSTPAVVPAEAAQQAQTLPKEAPKPATAPPPELMSAQSLTPILKWFLAHGLSDVDAILAKCTEWKSVVPALGRVNLDRDRIGRGLAVLQQTH